MPLIAFAAHLKSLTPGHCVDNGDVNAFLARLARAPQLPALSRIEFAGGEQVSPPVLPKLMARFRPALEGIWFQSVTVAEGHVGDVLRRLAAWDRPAPRCVTVKTCAQGYFCPRLLLRQHDGTEWAGSGGGFEVTLRSYRTKCRVNSVRYRGGGDGIRRALSALGDSAYTLQLRGPELGTTNLCSAGGRAVRVVQDLFYCI